MARLVFPAFLADAFSELEKNDHPVIAIRLHPRDLSEHLKFQTVQRKGVPMFWNAKVVKDAKVPRDTVWLSYRRDGKRYRRRFDRNATV